VECHPGIFRSPFSRQFANGPQNTPHARSPPPWDCGRPESLLGRLNWSLPGNSHQPLVKKVLGVWNFSLTVASFPLFLQSFHGPAQALMIWRKLGISKWHRLSSNIPHSPTGRYAQRNGSQQTGALLASRAAGSVMVSAGYSTVLERGSAEFKDSPGSVISVVHVATVVVLDAE
jgi:hypothetical protein